MSFESGTEGIIVEPEYGSLKMYKKNWNTYDETLGQVFFNDI